ncbi:hypothetical protein [Aeromonas dhakensis]
MTWHTCITVWGDGVSDELGIGISYLAEQFVLLAAAYRAPAEMETQQ